MPDPTDSRRLPGYLHHIQGDSWFQPFTYLAGLPTKPSTAASGHDKIAHVHEHVHYLQASTSFFGVNRFHSLWRSIAEFSKIEHGGALAEGQLEQVRDAYLERMIMIDEQDLARPIDIREQLADGPQWVNTGERLLGTYSKKLQGRSRLFPLGAFALQEGMAMAVERWLEHSAESYEMALNSDEMEFFYAAPAEAVSALSGWKGDRAWWLTVIIADIALNGLIPHRDFLVAARTAGELWPVPPPEEELSKVYGRLRDEVQMHEVDELRQSLLAELEAIVERAGDSTDEFDIAMVRMFRRMRDAMLLRRERPHAFVEFLLYPAQHLDLLDRFYLPTYLVGDQLLTLGDDMELSHAALYLLAGVHYLRCRLGLHRDHQCPFASAFNYCKLPRVAECEASPWTRPVTESGEACIYRFVSHGLSKT